MLNLDGLTAVRREALICVSLGGVRKTRKADGSEGWRIASATDVEPPSEADLMWLFENGFIDLRWLNESSGAVRLTQDGVRALALTGER